MSFDAPTRNRLAELVGDIRTLLTDEFLEQCQVLFGISPAGNVTGLAHLGDLDDAERTTATLLRERITYLVRTRPDDKNAASNAVTQLVREQAFTVLNRVAALRMAEKRSLIAESVGKGYQSKGFKVFETVARTGLGDTYRRYRQYLLCLFDELALDLGVLFDRRAPQGMLFPRETTLLKCLDLLNAVDVEGLWAEDETIGWVYQYYNDPAERKKMREESAAPRNSRELAVRNQFFTPRYVVEFLTDNTLGRIWYESTQGSTRLKHLCRYLVRRPNETFLTLGEIAPAQPKQQNLSDEEPLKQPDFIPHRTLKDPRTTLLLDPACGSMHFGLYAFDLFETIYEEAWELEETLSPDALSRAPGMRSLHDTYAAKDAFLKDVPRLIVQHNLHGIDIDPRCAQIAGLSLWLRAQKAWQRLGLTPAQRPIISRSNIVCAEPMPGDKGLLREFVDGEFSTAERNFFLRLLEGIFDQMQLAGEAGTLLKIEEEIRSAIAEAKQLWKEEPQLEQSKLFVELETAKQGALTFDLSGITDEQFWDTAETRIYAALRGYAEQSESGGNFHRRLFAEDAAQGFAFIDVCRKRYDVVLMNPPFGEPSVSSRGYLYSTFESSKKDVFAAFVDRGIQVASAVGAITSRTCFFLPAFQTWRHGLTKGGKRISALADLADGVLDAMVETAAYTVMGSLQHECAFFRVTETPAKAEHLLQLCQTWHDGRQANDAFVGTFSTFDLVPTSPFAYYLSAEEASLFRALPALEPAWGSVIRGPEVPDLVRAARCWWEVPPSVIGKSGRWVWYAKGGEFKRFAHDVHLVVDYEGALKGSCPFRRSGDQQYYFRGGITYSQRTTKPISFRVLPSGCLTSPKGPAVIPRAPDSLLALLGLTNTRLFSNLVNSRVGAAGAAARSYDLDILRQIPLPRMGDVSPVIEEHTQRALACGQGYNQTDEVSPDFVSVGFRLPSAATLRDLLELSNATSQESQEVYDTARSITESLAMRACKVEKSADRSYAHESAFPLLSPVALVEAVVSYGLGCALGRWDIRYATGENAAPELPDPFAPLPVCPPGQLQSAQGLPARQEDLPAGYPVRIPWDGILVDDPSHPLDVERRVREIIGIIWKDRAEAIEQEAGGILGVQSLRDYFRKPGGFFAAHLKCYSKSRRKAPIFWPLSTSSGSYTLWIYHHRLSDQTLHTALADFVEPKIRDIERSLTEARSANRQKEVEEFANLLAELHDFRAELERVIRLPWKPNLNDGVLITASPLWKLFRLPKWQKDLKSCWQELQAGDYDWAHLALCIWPDRVKTACQTDRSIAIAHGLEDLFNEPVLAQRSTKGNRTRRAGKRATP